jgi:dolichol-phosphate mannosyltransferase
MAIPSFQDTHSDRPAAPMRAGRHSQKMTMSPMVGRMSRFAAVGAFGTVLNLGIMSVMLGLGTHYLVAAVVATELTILSNFLMQERLVFRDMREGRPLWQRFAANFGFNNIEALVRMPVLVLLVDLLLIPGLVAQATTLAVAFLVRFAFTSQVIYRVRPSASTPLLVPATATTPVGVETG